METLSCPYNPNLGRQESTVIRYNHIAMRSENFKSFTFKKFVLLTGLAVVAAGLLLFIYLSYFNRYWADDWCYNADLRNKGFIETLGGYFNDVTYTPSRYSVTIFAGL